jgi:hypothetical protein
MPDPNASVFSFQKSGKFLAGNTSGDITIDATRSSVVAQAIAKDDDFPPGTIRMGTLAAKASAGTGDIQFGSNANNTVSFNAAGGMRAGLGIYTGSSDMFADLGGNDKLLDGISLNDAGVRRYVTLCWGYNIKAAAKGAVALGAGLSGKFGVDAASEGLFAFIRAFKQEPKARQAIGDVIEGWCLPRQVKDQNALKPGSWAVAEVDGNFAATLGAQYGYNFNWIRKVGLQGLSGEVGLKIQAAVEVQLGFSAGGKYIIIVGRDSLDPADGTIRVRLHKLSQKGLSFALNAALGVTGTTDKLLPDQMDQLIAAMFGTSTPQIVEDLKILRSVADPSVPLNKLAGDFIVDFAQKELSTVVDMKARFDQAKNRIVHFLDVCDGLGAKASSILWDAVGNPALKEAFAKSINALAAPEADRKKLIETELSNVDFYRTPIGQFLESQATDTVLAMLNNNPELARIQEIAVKVKEVLDGKVLDQLTKFVTDKFSVEKIRNLSLEDLDKRLKEKLADFLEKPLDNAGLQEIRNTLNELVKKADKLYAEAIKALNKTYKFKLHAAYQKTTTKDALIDASFDFKQNADLASALAGAIDGDFQKLLVNSPPGVKINTAAMTHGVTRQSSVDFNMPYYASSAAGLNQALAKLHVKAEDGGLYMFDLQASDRQTMIRNNQNRWSSRLAVCMKLASLAGSSIRHYSDMAKLGEDTTVGYSFRRAIYQMKTASMLHQIAPLKEAYFPDQFDVAGRPSLLDWVTDLDKYFDTIENNGTGRLGNTLLSMELSLPGKVLTGWLSAPADERNPAYLAMSIGIQTALKRLIPYCYFQDVKRCVGANSFAAAVLTYAAIPPSNSLQIGYNNALVPEAHPSYYWDPFDGKLFDAMAPNNPKTVQNLAAALVGIRNLLASTEGMQGDADYYKPAHLGEILRAATSGAGLNWLRNSLLYTEAEVLKSAVNAGKDMAKFRQSSGQKPAEALERLAEFGHHLTEAFSGKLTDLFNASDEPDLLRNFGLLVFIEASRYLRADSEMIRPAAAVDVAILRTKNDKGPIVFPPDKFPDNDPVPAENIGIEQRILSVV